MSRKHEEKMKRVNSIVVLVLVAATAVSLAGSAARPAAAAREFTPVCCWRFAFAGRAETFQTYHRAPNDDLWREGTYRLSTFYQRRGIRYARSLTGLEPVRQSPWDASIGTYDENGRVFLIGSNPPRRSHPYDCDAKDNTGVFRDHPTSYTVRFVDTYVSVPTGFIAGCPEAGLDADLKFFTPNHGAFRASIGNVLPVGRIVRGRGDFELVCTYKLETNEPNLDFRGWITLYVRFTYFVPKQLGRFARMLNGFFGEDAFPPLAGRVPVLPFGDPAEPFPASAPPNGCRKP